VAIYEAGDVITLSAKSTSVTVLLRGAALLDVAGAPGRAENGAFNDAASTEAACAWLVRVACNFAKISQVILPMRLADAGITTHLISHSALWRKGNASRNRGRGLHGGCFHAGLGSMHGPDSDGGEDDAKQRSTPPRSGSTISSAIGAVLGARSSVDGVLSPSQGSRSSPRTQACRLMCHQREEISGWLTRS